MVTIEIHRDTSSPCHPVYSLRWVLYWYRKAAVNRYVMQVRFLPPQLLNMNGRASQWAMAPRLENG